MRMVFLNTCAHWLLPGSHVLFGSKKILGRVTLTELFPNFHATESLCGGAWHYYAFALRGSEKNLATQGVFWGLSLFLTIVHGVVHSETLCQCGEAVLLFRIQGWPVEKGRRHEASCSSPVPQNWEKIYWSRPEPLCLMWPLSKLRDASFCPSFHLLSLLFSYKENNSHHRQVRK